MEVPTSVRDQTTLVLAAASVPAALVAIFAVPGKGGALTVAGSLVGLVPWALVAGGVRLRPPVFALACFVPGAVVVVVDLNPGGLFPLLLLVTAMPRSSGHQRWIEAGAVVGNIAVIVWLTIHDGGGNGGSAFFVGGIGIGYLSGTLIRRQEELTAQVRAMADVDRERRAADERAHIAREVHDVVAHSLTVVMLNLTGARRALATDPARADEALARAEAVGRESLASIRQVMDVLREPGSGTDLAPPTIDGLAALVSGYRSAGLPVSLVGSVDPDRVGATVGLVVYRLVQEALANVLQHSPGAGATVVLALDDALEVTVANGPATAAPSTATARTGLGTRGMGERVRALGGTVRAGSVADGGWEVHATIPVPDPARVASGPDG